MTKPTLQSSQYTELEEMKEDEYFYAIAYELAIRAARLDIIYLFNLIDISNGTLCPSSECKKNEYFKPYKPYVSKIDGHIIEYPRNIDIGLLLNYINNQLTMKWGLALGDLYLDYTFIPESVKEKNSLIVELKEGTITVGKTQKYEMFKKDNFIRKEKTIFDIKEDETLGYKLFPQTKEYHYSKIYKRGFLAQFEEDDKKAFIQIDVHAPKSVILSQISSLIDNIKEDTAHIMTGKQIYNNNLEEMFGIKHNDIDYENESTDIKNPKGAFIQKLFIYDYFIAREAEILKENKKREQILKQKIDYIKKQGFATNDLKEQMSILRYEYREILLKDIHDEIANITEKSIDTVQQYIKDIKSLLKEKKYLQLINGKALK